MNMIICQLLDRIFVLSLPDNLIRGCWPVFNHISSFSQYYIEIISQCPCNHIFIIFMYNIMCEYNTYVKPLALDYNVENLKKSLTSVVPEGCILTVSDKGLGSVLLPHSWFICEYQKQAELGGHEKILSIEGAMLVELYGIIAVFRQGLSLLESALFKSIFKYTGNNLG